MLSRLVTAAEAEWYFLPALFIDNDADSSGIMLLDASFGQSCFATVATREDSARAR